MTDAQEVSQELPSNSRWKALIAINLVLGFLLWAIYLTDYSLAGNVADIVFPVGVCGAGLVSLGFSGIAPTRVSRLVTGLTCLPSIIGGGLAIIVGVLLFIPPFTLGGMFLVLETATEQLVQEVESPDRSRVAQVYFRAVGAYSAGEGRVFVRVRYSQFPLVERDVYYVSPSYSDGTDYVSWLDNDTLYIREVDETVTLGIVRPTIPAVIGIPIKLIQLVLHAFG
jgi:hypothetical protein